MSLQLQADFYQDRLKLLQEELDAIKSQTHTFEATLRAHLMDEIILEQELTVLYKEQKAAKKQKRQAQKKKSKGALDPKIVCSTKAPVSKVREEEKAKRKKLYREAMIQVHPDKFSLEADKQDLATEMTCKLIELYAMGSLEELEAYYRHIFKGQMLEIKDSQTKIAAPDTYLADEIARVETLIQEAKAKQTYQVLMTYPEPMDFLKELKAYYEDRLFKLRKRTRFSNV